MDKNDETPLSLLKNKWLKFHTESQVKNSIWQASEEYKKFEEWCNEQQIINKDVPPHWNFDSLKIQNYTSLLNKNGDNYFTNLMERTTASCGRFRAASSYAYGI